MSNEIIIPAIGPGGQLYPIEKLDAHRKGLLHLAISVFVFSGDRLLIQRRANAKYHSGGLWANTCCTHPGWGEDLEMAAHRRLKDELGLSVPSLEGRSVIEYRAQVSDNLWEHERVHVFCHRFETSLPKLEPAPEEVSAIRWVTELELRTDMLSNPERFAPWFRIYVSRWDELNLLGDAPVV